jgi:hypothetical protein
MNFVKPHKKEENARLLGNKTPMYLQGDNVATAMKSRN